MTSPPSRREFLAAIGTTTGLTGLSGCLSGGLPGSGRNVDQTLYIGAYHWGFVLLDADGNEHDQLVLDRGTTIRLVAFNTNAEQALEKLPPSVQNAMPEHHELEERNEDRIPHPQNGDMHELLDEANERYPNHSVAVMPSGGNHMGGGMWDGMMMHPLALPRDATRPRVATMTASRRGDYTLSCMTNCGYGHAYMDLDGAIVVR